MNKSHLTNVSVKDLFGRFNHDINFTSENRLGILYGDNGCGKSTILKLIFNALSPKNKNGHRTYIAQVPFTFCSISTASGYIITISRPHAVKGDYQMKIELNGEALAICNYIVDEEGAISGSIQDPDHDAIIDVLSKMNCSIYLLPDDRKVLSTKRKNELQKQSSLFYDEEEKTFTTLIENATKEITSWARNRVFFANRQGESQTSNITTVQLKLTEY